MIRASRPDMNAGTSGYPIERPDATFPALADEQLNCIEHFGEELELAADTALFQREHGLAPGPRGAGPEGVCHHREVGVGCAARLAVRDLPAGDLCRR